MKVDARRVTHAGPVERLLEQIRREVNKANYRIRTKERNG